MFRNLFCCCLTSIFLQAVVPDSLRVSFTLTTPSISLPSYLYRARHSFASLYSSHDFRQPTDIQSLVSFFDSAEGPAFALMDLSTLHDIKETHGSSSYEYIQVGDRLRAYLEQILDDDTFNLAILTLPPPSLFKRQAPVPSHAPSPQQPIGSISTCFTTVDVCNNSTSSCSGRGTCVQASKAGRTCFVCSCDVTKTGEGNKVKTVAWAGQSCERKDISAYVTLLYIRSCGSILCDSPFVLLSGTVIVIIVLFIGSVSLLYSVGEQPLPSTLLATAVNVKKD